MASSMQLISRATVGSGGSSSITFSSIPQTFTDLMIRYSLRTNRSGQYDDDVFLSFNSATTTYAYRYMKQTSTTVSSSSGASRYMGVTSAALSTSNTFANGETYIVDYTGSLGKCFQNISTTSANNSPSYNFIMGTKWTTTDSITSITLTSGTSNNFVEYSSATLYGIKKFAETGTGSKATGGTVTTSGGYTIHTFYTSGMFAPSASITGADVLVVAGGGGGGFYYGGGGGAGGFQTFTSQSFTSGVKYAAIIGAGGLGSAVGTARGSNGTTSVLGSLTASVGGGGGGSNNNVNGALGGSGGGGSGSGAPGTGGAATSGQGNAGGNQPASAPNYGSGGGGGAGQAGGVGTGTEGGKGGNGTSNSYSGSAVIYAGGGGGASAGGVTGRGGLGGGGGAGANIAAAGLSNTGGGGGGIDNNASGFGAAGGSGIIIVRYTT